MTEQFAQLDTGIDLCFETFGKPTDPAILLIMGLGGPMTWWSKTFCERLARQGFFIIRYDNRDTGKSTILRHKPVTFAQLAQAFAGRGIAAPYGMNDFADDAAGLLDHMDIESAHVVGVSMGGMIGQTLALHQPARVASLTSIMSTTGNRRVGWQAPRILPRLIAPMKPTREAYIARSVANARVLESPAFPTTHAAKVDHAAETFDRGWKPSGVNRHMLAVLTQVDRTRALGSINVPTAVIHGTQDPMVHRSGGAATAQAIPDAELTWIPGLAHDLPEQLEWLFARIITRTAHRT